jgi:hypothetical protein
MRHNTFHALKPIVPQHNPPYETVWDTLRQGTAGHSVFRRRAGRICAPRPNYHQRVWKPPSQVRPRNPVDFSVANGGRCLRATDFAGGPQRVSGYPHCRTMFRAVQCSESWCAAALLRRRATMKVVPPRALTEGRVYRRVEHACQDRDVVEGLEAEHRVFDGLSAVGFDH